MSPWVDLASILMHTGGSFPVIYAAWWWLSMTELNLSSPKVSWHSAQLIKHGDNFTFTLSELPILFGYLHCYYCYSSKLNRQRGCEKTTYVYEYLLIITEVGYYRPINQGKS